MQTQDKDILHNLLVSEETAALGVSIEKRPYVGMVPFVYWPQRTACVIHTSSMAQHSRGLYSGAPVSLLIKDSRWKENALQTPRVTLNGEVSLALPNTTLYNNAKALYLQRFPSASITFTFQDFSLFILHIQDARLVAGFGRAYTLSKTMLQSLFEEIP